MPNVFWSLILMQSHDYNLGHYELDCTQTVYSIEKHKKTEVNTKVEPTSLYCIISKFLLIMGHKPNTSI